MNYKHTLSHFAARILERNSLCLLCFGRLDWLDTSPPCVRSRKRRPQTDPRASFQSVQLLFCVVSIASEYFWPNQMSWSGVRLDANRTCRFDDLAFRSVLRHGSANNCLPMQRHYWKLSSFWLDCLDLAFGKCGCGMRPFQSHHHPLKGNTNIRNRFFQCNTNFELISTFNRCRPLISLTQQ